jgi:hypothetical protein
MSVAPELELVQELARRLAPYGAASIAYLTAEFQPFSNAQKPDLVFSPASGGRKGQTAVVEFKVEASPRATGRSFLNLLEHKEFCEESLDRSIYSYVFVTNQPTPEFSVSQLARGGVRVIRFEGDSEALVPDLLEALEVTTSGC